MNDIVLTDEQQAIFNKIVEWASPESANARSEPSEKSLGGLAGTGKTSMLAKLLEALPAPCVVTPTGRAAGVLRTKLGDSPLNVYGKVVKISTVHQLLYRLKDEVENDDGFLEPVFAPKVAQNAYRRTLIIIDEASMVGAEMAADLRAIGCDILWIGDHGQLEPIGDDPKIMANPTWKLETIHRQAADSPIIKCAHHVRNGRGFTDISRMPGYEASDKLSIIHGRGCNMAEYAMRNNLDQILVGRNAERLSINADYRRFWHAAMGQRASDAAVLPNDRMICLLNNHAARIMNGDQLVIYDTFSVKSDYEGLLSVEVEAALLVDGMHQMPLSTRVVLFVGGLGVKGMTAINQQRYRELALQTTMPVIWVDYGYAITVHKAQGSQWPRVLLVNTGDGRWDAKRWRYTGCTRAQEALHVVL